jgi:hypothetical protein
MESLNDQPTGLTDREPIALITSLESVVKTLVLAILAMALTFNWITWTDEQNAAVIGVIAAVFALMSVLFGAFMRLKVTPTKAPRSNAGAPLVPFRADG